MGALVLPQPYRGWTRAHHENHKSVPTNAPGSWIDVAPGLSAYPEFASLPILPLYLRRFRPLSCSPDVVLPHPETVLLRCVRVTSSIPEASPCFAKRINAAPTRFADDYDPATHNERMSNLRQIDLRRRTIKAGAATTVAVLCHSLAAMSGMRPVQSVRHVAGPYPPKHPPPPPYPRGV